jgi:L,D-transpeptidase YcbB
MPKLLQPPVPMAHDNGFASGGKPLVRIGFHLALALTMLGGAVTADGSPWDSIALGIATTLAASPEGVEADASARASLAEFYARRGYAPAWAEGDRLGRLVSALEGLADDGLSPGDYAVSTLRRHLAEGPRGAERWVQADLMATETLLLALTHLAQGRIDPAEVEPIWHLRGEEHARRTRERIVDWASEHLDNPDAALAAARPALPLYQALRRAHAEWSAGHGLLDWPAIPPGPSLREDMSDPRVPLLRRRLQETPAGPPQAVWGEHVYDRALVDAVMAFQRTHGLEVDGIVGRETLAALNVSPAARLDQIRANLERMRWLGDERPPVHVLVDIAGASIQFVQDGETLWSARTQVGRPSRPSPSLVSEITHLTFNPTWTVPPTILRNDKLPEIRRDIGYLGRNRMRVLDPSGRELAPEDVDWDQPMGILLRQDAGPFNALGKVAFRFPNPFHVYLHDTPSQRLFASEQRAFSSGCIRVERARELVDVLLSAETDERRDLAYSLLEGERTRDFHLARPVPILVFYRTVETGPDGGIVFRADVYRRDQRLADALADTSGPAFLGHQSARF